MISILESLQGAPTVYRFQEGSELPKDFCIMRDKKDYSLQVARDMTLDEFNGKLTKYLETLPSQTKSQFLEAWNDEDDQDN
ncbi:hypothetical protein HDU76_013923 [Blyttiomyces sp. JEL0837]|nr:hypothetical protein HDU76_013923 [Blyttiomyces sp. JEL0837]